MSLYTHPHSHTPHTHPLHYLDFRFLLRTVVFTLCLLISNLLFFLSQINQFYSQITHSLTYSFTQSLTYSFTQSLNHLFLTPSPPHTQAHIHNHSPPHQLLSLFSLLLSLYLFPPYSPSLPFPLHHFPSPNSPNTHLHASCQVFSSFNPLSLHPS